jgi:hypothetical protein
MEWYLELVVRIYERISADPEQLVKLRKAMHGQESLEATNSIN